MAIKEKKQLIVFDVEGVLIPKNMFFFQIGRMLGFFTLVQILLYRLFYEMGICSLDASLKGIFRKMKGQKMETLQCVFDKIPATSSLQSFFACIREKNYHIAIVSSSLPTVIVERLADCLGADYAFGIDVCVNAAGEITGEVRGGESIEVNGKMKILQKLLTLEGLTLQDCTIVAKDRSNLCLFTSAAKKIGYNPNFRIRIKSDYVIVGKLAGILPILNEKHVKRSFPSVNDFVRENIHAAGIIMPILAHIIGVIPVAIFIGALSIAYFASEIARLCGKSLPLISTITRHAASQSELYGFAAAPLFYAIGILATLLIFPYPVNAAAIAIFTLGDSVASIFGGTIGIRLPFNRGKTLEGSLSGFVFAFLASSLFVAPWIAVIGAAIAMFVEYLPVPINDNIMIPIVTATVLMLLI
ncbi:MAG: haloacid dehalogenase-like hydrolase [Nitrososphaerota archaeon]|jgi:dolichol kinase/phosphoserine phosphatase|nr:haloacid dehalogenase-like hydrolase [Nitrososphaerota archaeon]